MTATATTTARPMLDPQSDEPMLHQYERLRRELDAAIAVRVEDFEGYVEDFTATWGEGASQVYSGMLERRLGKIVALRGERDRLIREYSDYVMNTEVAPH